MQKNSTFIIDLWENIFQDDYSFSDNDIEKKQLCKELSPRKETLDFILAYSKSVKIIKNRYIDDILISLN
tara:strand:- start:449 stop:658 length:210 start_codon:yes stop_codon:yes gene_type:complete